MPEKFFRVTAYKCIPIGDLAVPIKGSSFHEVKQDAEEYFDAIRQREHARYMLVTEKPLALGVNGTEVISDWIARNGLPDQGS